MNVVVKFCYFAKGASSVSTRLSSGSIPGLHDYGCADAHEKSIDG